MFRLLCVQCVVLGMVLSGCAGPRPTAIAPPPPASPPATVEASGQGAPEWIAAGAVVQSGVPPEVAPPVEKAADGKPRWTTQVARKGKDALRETARFTGGVVLSVAIVGGILGVIVLYGMASGNTGR